jgi:hypothetical protein
MKAADIFMTTLPGRSDLTYRSIMSLCENTKMSDVRFSVYIDGLGHSKEVISLIENVADHIIISKERQGLPQAINRTLSYISATNDYFSSVGAADNSEVSPFICMVQDDLEYTNSWLNTIISRFTIYEKKFNLKFASGVECIEHPISADIGNGCILKKYIRAANMFARREYWLSMFPIPRFDPETRSIRAFPSNGIGSGVDWWFIRNHQNSVVKTNSECLVIPGLLRHIGYANSTWLDRELPESDNDKKAMSK